MENENTQLVKFEKSINVLKDTGLIYSQNKDSYTKAIASSNKLIELVQKQPINNDLFKQLKMLKSKLSATKVAMIERRKPVTQIMDELKKEFTSMENTISDKSDIVLKITGFINSYARELELKRIEEENKRRAELEKVKETESATFDYDYFLKEKMYEYLFQKKQEHVTLLDNCNTLDDLEKAYTTINQCSLIYDSPNDIDGFCQTKQYKHLKSNEVMEILVEKHNSTVINLHLINEYKNQMDICIVELNSKKQTYINRIQERIELESKKQKDKQALLEKQEKERQAIIAEQKKKIQDELNIKLSRASVDKSISIIENSMKSTAKIQSAVAVPVVAIKNKYKITINNHAGWGQLFTFWFENEAKELSEEKIGNMTLLRCKSYAEARAEKDHVFIESESLVYNKEIVAK
jgi:hypothetical protein